MTAAEPGHECARAPVVLPMRWEDIEQVAVLEQVLFPTDSPWTAAMFWAELAAGRHYVVVRCRTGGALSVPDPIAADPVSADRAGAGSRDGVEVLGYAGIAIGPDEAEVQTIAVRPERQGRGIGRALLADLLLAAEHRRVLLEVRTDNEPALSLYRSVGFTVAGRRRRYYQPSGADAYTMSREPAREER